MAEPRQPTVELERRYGRHASEVLDRLRRTHSERRSIGSGPAPWQVLAGVLADGGAERVECEVLASGLRGRGGAGFPAARKWALARARANMYRGRSAARSVLVGQNTCPLTVAKRTMLVSANQS